MDHITGMRKVLLVVVFLASSACGTSGQWQKPGTEQSVVDDDLRKCRHVAVQETLRLYADWLPFAFDAPLFWNGRDLPTSRLVHQITEISQRHAEQMLFLVCMRDKGYAIANA